MTPSNLTVDSTYRSFVELLLRRHRLLAAQTSDSAEIDALEDRMTALWEKLDESQRQSLNGLGSDLNWARRRGAAAPKARKAEEVSQTDRANLAAAEAAQDPHAILHWLRVCSPAMEFKDLAQRRRRAYTWAGLPQVAEVVGEALDKRDPTHRMGGADGTKEPEDVAMIPKKEEFVLDVRRAARLAERPTVITSSGLANPEVVANTLHRAALWLTPKVVERYDPAEFSDQAAGLRDGLARAVENFRGIAATVPADQPATGEQFSRGEEAFRNLLSAVRAVVLVEWKEAVDGLVGTTESWAKEFGWVAKQVQRRLSETLLGTYEMPQLLMHAAPNLYVLDPIARFVPGATGAFDLSIQPSFYTINLYRDYNWAWYAHHDVGEGTNTGKRDLWSKDTLKKCVEELGSLQ